MDSDMKIVFGGIAALLLFLLGPLFVGQYFSNEQTNECYKILASKTAVELRITCGVIK